MLRLSLCLFGCLAFAQSPDPAFEVATIKPAAPNQNGFGSRNTHNTLVLWNNDLRNVILFAYKLHDYELSGGPKWISSETFDITGQVDDATAGLPAQAKLERMRAMLRTLLAERCQLVVRRDTKPVQGFALSVAKSGLKVEAGDQSSGGLPGTSAGPKMLRAKDATMAQFANLLASKLGRPVIDRTGVNGTFNFDLHFAADNGPADPTEPSFFTALQEQCGLRLESTPAPVEALIVERIEHPVSN